MDGIVYVVGTLDAAELTLYAFFAFFFGLVFFIQRESRREGFPLVEASGEIKPMGWIFLPTPKVFRMADGHTHTAPPPAGEDRQVNLVSSGESGAAALPAGNPFLDGVGPASWTPREDIPDVTHTNEPKIVPMRVASEFSVVPGDVDLRGVPVWSYVDRKAAGTVSDIWVDRAESLIRYLEVELPGSETTSQNEDGSMVSAPTAGRKVLLPMTMVRLRKRGKSWFVMVGAVTSEQFRDVPGTTNPNQVTRLEEEKIMAYYGGGYLYSHPRRGESFL